MDTEAPGFRYERKFFISDLTRQQVETIVKMHPAFFSEIYHRRFINNIYFDTPGLKNYYDNLDGMAQRKKVRIRWYGELFASIESPLLELKCKYGLMGKKDSFTIPRFEMGRHFAHSEIAAAIEGDPGFPETAKAEFKTLVPVLLNRYSRKYYRSADGNYRITIDTGMVFYAVGNWGNSFAGRITDNDNIVLELKYDAPWDDHADEVTTCFPFRLSRSSKYVTGIQKLYG